MILNKRYIFKFAKVFSKLGLLRGLQDAPDKGAYLFDQLFANLGKVEDDIDEILSELYPDKDIKNLDMLPYMELINEIYVDNKSFFTQLTSGLTSTPS